MSIYTRICRELYVFRSSSAPYISGDSFRASIRNRVEGKRPDFRRAYAPIVFCEGESVEGLFRARREKPGEPFVLVTGNGDRNFGAEWIASMPMELVFWFGQNILFEHPRVAPLPIGLENRYYGNSGKVDRIERIRRSAPAKETKIFYSLNVHTNRAERAPALAAAKAHPLGLGSEKRIPVEEFQHRMASCQFVLSPPGNGFDCHRTWEALYLGTMPIVKRSGWSDYFSGIGVPMLALESWSELESLDAQYLNGWYETHRSMLGAEALYFDYWKRAIGEKAAIASARPL